jgi:hypothetical protein
MMRLACALVLVALTVLAAVALRPTGATAILFSFVGIPALGLGAGLYLLARWRAGAFRSDGTERL